jgi:hypothetical protein
MLHLSVTRKLFMLFSSFVQEWVSWRILSNSQIWCSFPVLKKIEIVTIKWRRSKEEWWQNLVCFATSTWSSWIIRSQACHCLTDDTALNKLRSSYSCNGRRSNACLLLHACKVWHGCCFSCSNDMLEITLDEIVLTDSRSKLLLVSLYSTSTVEMLSFEVFRLQQNLIERQQRFEEKKMGKEVTSKNKNKQRNCLITTVEASSQTNFRSHWRND